MLCWPSWLVTKTPTCMSAVLCPEFILSQERTSRARPASLFNNGNWGRVNVFVVFIKLLIQVQNPFSWALRGAESTLLFSSLHLFLYWLTTFLFWTPATCCAQIKWFTIYSFLKKLPSFRWYKIHQLQQKRTFSSNLYWLISSLCMRCRDNISRCLRVSLLAALSSTVADQSFKQMCESLCHDQWWAIRESHAPFLLPSFNSLVCSTFYFPRRAGSY